MSKVPVSANSSPVPNNVRLTLRLKSVDSISPNTSGSGKRSRSHKETAIAPLSFCAMLSSVSQTDVNQVHVD